MPEQFTNKATTTLNGAINNAVTSLVVTSATGFPTAGNFRIVVDANTANEEVMTVTAVSGTTFTVARATEAIAGVQTAFSHADLATVKHVLTAGAIKSTGQILLESKTASSSATLDFTASITSSYDEYIVEFVSIAPATNAAELRMQVSTNGGSTWDTTAGRYYMNSSRATGATWSTYNGGASLTALGLCHNIASASPSLGATGALRVLPTGSGQRWIVGTLHYLPNASDRVVCLVNGDYENGTFNAMRFLFSSGNIASGTINVYGLAK